VCTAAALHCPIVSTLGYSPQSVVASCGPCNMMKSTLSLRDFMRRGGLSCRRRPAPIMLSLSDNYVSITTSICCQGRSADPPKLFGLVRLLRDSTKVGAPVYSRRTARSTRNINRVGNSELCGASVGHHRRIEADTGTSKLALTATSDPANRE
jgi:hypothetical protein